MSFDQHDDMESLARAMASGLREDITFARAEAVKAREKGDQKAALAWMTYAARTYKDLELAEVRCSDLLAKDALTKSVDFVIQAIVDASKEIADELKHNPAEPRWEAIATGTGEKMLSFLRTVENSSRDIKEHARSMGRRSNSNDKKFPE